MSTPTSEHQIIKGPDGNPLYVLIPYEEYAALTERPDEEVLLPADVVTLAVVEGKGIVRAWREHFGLTQAALAKRLGISQPALAQLESPRRVLRFETRKRLAEAMGIETEQLRLVEEGEVWADISEGQEASPEREYALVLCERRIKYGVPSILPSILK